MRAIIVPFVFLLSFTMFCRNPFFPETGIPTQTFMMRGTPEGVIDQLYKAYEEKRLDLYEDILADSFQFYVAPTFISLYVTKYSFERELPDTTLQFIDNAEYYYFWTREAEVRSHRNLLTADKTIQFTSRPEITAIRYINNQKGDTTNAELLTSGGDLTISVISSTQIIRHSVSIEKQVFFLERDKDGLWVIRKWFDLSSASSLE